MRKRAAIILRASLLFASAIGGYFLLMIGLQIPFVFWLMLLGAACRKGRRWAGSGWSHGSARMASLVDLLRHGLLGDDGLILGTTGFMPRPTRRQGLAGLLSPSLASDLACSLFLSAFLGSRWPGDRMIRLGDFVHLATFAPTGRGKGVSVLVPNLFSYKGSCVVTDPKGELFRITANHRRQKFGHRIIRLDPFGLGGPGCDTLNPLDCIDANSDDFLDQCRDLANMMVLRSGREPDPHWNDAAEGVLTAFIAYVCACETDPKERNLQGVRELISSRHTYMSAVEIMQKVETHLGVIQRSGHSLTWSVDKELGSVMTTVQRHTQFLDSPPVARNTAKSSFDPMALRSGRASVYLCLPHDRLETLAPLTRLWIGVILRTITRGTPSEKNPVVFFLDEAAHLGKIRVLEQAVTLMRGMGIRLWFFYQSLSQVQETFGDKATTILENIDTQQYFGINSYFTADEISKRIGDTTISLPSRGGNSGRSYQSGIGQESSSFNTGSSVTYSDTGRRLFKPEELMVLPEEVALIFHRNVPVIPAMLFKYFEHPAFGGRPKAGRGWRLKPDPVAVVLLVGFLVTAAVAVFRSATATNTRPLPRVQTRRLVPPPRPQWRLQSRQPRTVRGNGIGYSR